MDRTSKEMGIALFLTIMFVQGLTWVIVNFWRELIVLFLGAYLLDYGWAHFFSPMTRDLSREIATQYHKVKVVGFPVLEYRSYSETVSELRLSVHNGAKGRITALTVACDGQSTDTPPDTDSNGQPYPAVTKKYSMERELRTVMIEPGATQTVLYGDYAHALPLFETDRQHLSCHVTGADFVQSDMYRAAGEMDRGGTARLADHLVSRPGSKPVTYHGDDYPIFLTGPVKNVGSKTVNGFKVSCLYEYDGPTLDGRYESISQNFSTKIKPGQTVQFSNKVVMDKDPAYSHKPLTSTCHISKVW